MYILSKQFSDKFNRLYTKSMNDNKIDNDEYNELVKVYEDYKKNKKNKLSIFLNLIYWCLVIIIYLVIKKLVLIFIDNHNYKYNIIINII